MRARTSRAAFSDSSTCPDRAMLAASRAKARSSFTFVSLMILISARTSASEARRCRRSCTSANREAAALMRSIALKGHRVGDEVLSPESCLEVANFVIDESLAVGRNLDMRIMVNSFSDRLQWEAKKAERDWKDLILCRFQERAVPGKKEGRAARTEREREIARSIKDMPRPERLARWVELTALSEKALYRRMSEG